MDVKRLLDIDTDGDGFVTRSELYDGLLQAGLPADKAAKHANDFFNIADRRNTNQVRLKDVGAVGKSVRFHVCLVS